MTNITDKEIDVLAGLLTMAIRKEERRVAKSNFTPTTGKRDLSKFKIECWTALREKLVGSKERT